MSDKRATIRLDVDVKKGQQELKGLTGDLKGTKRSATTTKESLDGLGNTLSGLPGPIGAMARGFRSAQRTVTGLTASTKALRVALLATGIGAIVVALGSLIQAFRSTQEGTDRLNRILEPTRAIFSALFGVLQDLSLFLADTLVEAINNPGEAFANLITFLRNQVEVRIKALIDVFGGLGRVVGNIVTGQFKDAFDAAQDVGRSFVDLTTGIENATEKGIDFARSIKQVADDAIVTGKELQALREQIEQLRIDQEVPLARQRREYEELRNIVRDTSLAEEERLEAADRAIAIRQNIRDEEQKLLDLQIQELELRQSLNDTSREEELQLQRLIAQRESVAASAERELGRVLTQRASIVNSIDKETEKEREAAEEKREIVEDLTGSIFELEEQLSDARVAFRKAVTDAEREAAKERIEALEQQIETLQGVEQAEKKVTEERKRGNIDAAAGAKNLEEAKRGVLNQLFSEIVLEAIKSAFRNVPFPFNLVAAGTAGVGARQVISHLVPGFADGVTNFRGGTALVGERGPELVNLPKGSNVITNENTQDLLSQSIPTQKNDLISALERVNWKAETKVSRGDLVLVIKKELEQQRNLGGNGSL